MAKRKASKEIAIQHVAEATPSGKRTAKDFLQDMLDKGNKDWIDILAVARQIRNGVWYKEIRTMLQQKGLMPTDSKEIAKGSEVVRQRTIKAVERQKKERQPRRSPAAKSQDKPPSSLS